MDQFTQNLLLFSFNFFSIVVEAFPFIVLGVVIAGFLEEFVPQAFLTKIIPRNRVLAIGLGGVLGIVFPMCECGIIVVMRRLLRKGLPLSVCICYMLAGPVINGVVMVSTYVAFNPPSPEFYIFGGPANVVIIRCVMAFVVAFITALIVDAMQRKHGDALLAPVVLRGLNKRGAENDEFAPKRTWSQRIDNITGTALSDFIDILTFLILGAVLASVGRIVIGETGIATTLQQQPALAILIMMAIAIIFCLCSEADAFVAANFGFAFPPASKMAFMVAGPMFDLKLLIMYTRIFRPRLIVVIVSSVLIQVFLYSLALHYLPEWFEQMSG